MLRIYFQVHFIIAGISPCGDIYNAETESKLGCVRRKGVSGVRKKDATDEV